jgi:DNA-binding response OmpR family regulator
VRTPRDLARVRALLKRASTEPGVPRTEIRVDDLTIDFSARLVRRGRTEITLRPKEFDLLAALVRHRGRIVSRAELLREVWGIRRRARRAERSRRTSLRFASDSAMIHSRLGTS